MIRTTLARLAPPLLVAASLAACSSRPPADSVAAQVTFGVQMAQRGLWNEALFRFEQARRLSPDDTRALNNLAVSYEAVGRFEDALTAYRLAAQADPNNRALKQNFARFLEFYQAYRAKPATASQPPAPAPPAPEPTPPPAGGAS